jgi:hypothetical protein
MNAIPRKALRWYHVAVAFVLVWTIGLEFADRLPYLRTAISFDIRALIVFPLLLGPLVYLVFFRTYASMGGTTAYRYRMDSLPSQRERIRRSVVAIFAMPAICAGIAYSTIEVPAWIAYVTASVPFSHTYVVTQIKHLGGPLWTARYDLTLSEIDREKSVNLILTRQPYLKDHWGLGYVTCVQGRTSVFGSIVQSMLKGPCASR